MAAPAARKPARTVVILKPLKEKIAVLTGASRDAGRGIAQDLGAETSEMVTELGGQGIPERVDHTIDTEVEALCRRVQEEQGKLHILR